MKFFNSIHDNTYVPVHHVHEGNMIGDQIIENENKEQKEINIDDIDELNEIEVTKRAKAKMININIINDDVNSEIKITKVDDRNESNILNKEKIDLKEDKFK